MTTIPSVTSHQPPLASYKLAPFKGPNKAYVATINFGSGDMQHLYRPSREESGFFKRIQNALLRLIQPIVPYALKDPYPDEQTLWLDWSYSPYVVDPVVVYTTYPVKGTHKATGSKHSWVS